MIITGWESVIVCFTSRNEKKKLEELKNHYENISGKEEPIEQKLTSSSKFGLPIVFLIFSSVYWAAGLLKYLKGWKIVVFLMIFCIVQL